jgi:uncharacterized protein (TIGR02265 family)
VNVKGNVLLARLAFVREHFGEDAIERVVSTLPEADRFVLRGMIGNVGWYPLELAKQLDEAIVRVLGGGNSSVFEEIGAASAQKNLTTVHKLSLTVGNPQHFLAQTPVIYKLYYDQGSREYQQTGPTSGILTTHDAETFSAADCLTVIGWHKEALKMCGAVNVSMVEEECRALGGKVCRYRVRWDSVKTR